MHRNTVDLLKPSIQLILSASVAVVVYCFIHSTLQFTAQRVELLGYFPNQTTVKISNILVNGKKEHLDTFEVSGKADLQRVGTGYINKHVNRLEIEFNHNGVGLITLSRIRVFFPYLETYYFTQDNISGLFSSDQSASDNPRQYVGKHISVVSNQVLARPTSIAPLLLSALFFIGTWLLIKNSNVRLLPAFKDMSLGQNISSSGEFDAINGVRGLAAILVLFSHTAPGFEAVQLGLSLLFVISGFLLTKPFVSDGRKIFRVKDLEHYLTKRLRRILPMYYLYVFAVFGVTLEFETLARHLLFLEGDGHLWPMTQIFAFYMLLPIVLILTSAVQCLHRLAPIIVLSILGILAYRYLQEWKPFYNGRFSKEFFLYAFLLGVAFSYLYYDYCKEIKQWINERQHWMNLVGTLALVITILSIIWSAPIKPIAEIWYWMSKFWVKCALSGAIIVLALLSEKSFFRLIIGNWLFRSVGVIGFSFYLLHGLGMELFSEVQRLFIGTDPPGERSWSFVIGSFLFTYPMALLTYSYVERPFFGYHQKPTP
ncbi:acyltransferase [Arenicella sp. 4NH20-0111]|uniref:acyltransferase family protein n=1 Tax=Arenicella sp. 4NH20-0111 TaxID=3127648 RepID=UPI00333EFFEC